MDIVRNSDIAQLILGYLRDQNLEQAAYSFCKTSPYLTEEYQLLKKGLRTMSLGSGTLVDIIKEHCQIKSKISQVSYILPLEEKERILKQNTLVGKISFLIKTLMKDKRLTRQDNNQKRLKRARSNSSDDIEIKTQDLQSSVDNYPKRRRASDSYFFLGNSTMINGSISDQEYDDNDNDELSSVSNNDNDTTNTFQNEQVRQTKFVEIDKTLSSIEPTIPMLSETILKKTKFQDVLVENINKVLQISLQGNSENENSKRQTQEYEDPVEDTLTAQLDEMIKQILDTTEKDPIFDEVIEEVVNITSSAKKSPKSNQGSRLRPQKGSNDVESIKKLTSKESNNGETSAKLYSSNKSTQMTPQRETDFSPIQFGGKISNTIPASAPLASESNELNDTTCSSSTIIPVIDSNLPSKIFFFNSNDTLGTLTNDSTLLSCTNFNNIQTFNSNDQVFIDLSSGQMSIPLIMTNDNVTLPILINSSDIQQQSDNIDSNSLINRINSNKQNVDQLEVQQQITLDNQQTSRTQSTGVTTRSNKKNSNKNNVEATNIVDSNIINMEKSTPNDSNIRIPVRSFSTPRRRASHVRVLNFGSETPNKEQEQIQYKSLNNNNENIVEASSSLYQIQAPLSPIANNVEIQTSPKSIIMEALETASNSNSLDFDVECSNQTVIQRKISETPRRLKISVKKNCVRNISQSKKNIRNQPKSMKEKIDNINQNGSMSKSKITKKLLPLKNKKKADNNKIKNEEKMRTAANNKNIKIKNLNKTLEKSTTVNKEDNDGNTKGLDPLEEWNRMRATFSNPNWDQHLRILQSQSPNNEVGQLKKRSKRKQKKKKQDVSFKKTLKTKKSDDSKINEEIIDLENNKQQIENKDDNEKILTEKLNKNILSPLSSSVKNEMQPSLSSVLTHNKGSIKFKIVTTKNNSKKIKTINNVEDKDCEKEIYRKQQKKIRSSNENVDNILTNKIQHVESDNNKKENAIIPESSLPLKLSENKKNISTSLPLKQQSDGSNNMAMLLETPFKIITDTSSSSSFQIPITPRFIVPSVIEQTPITKIMKTIHYQQQIISTDHKQPNQILIDNLSTPNFAITPGAGLVTSIEKETPGGGYASSYSNRLTDYSSGGSYYKPDESDDLDKHLDRLLIAERKKKTTKLPPATTTLASELTEIGTAIIKNHNHTSKIDKIPLKKKNSDIDDVSRPTRQHQLRKQNMTKSSPSLLENNNNSNSLEKHNMKEFSSLTKRNHSKCFSSSNINSSPSTSNVTISVFPDDPIPTSKSKCNLSLSDVSSSEDEAWKKSDLLQRKTEEKLLLKTTGNDKNLPNSSIAVKQIEISNEKEKQLHELEKKRLRIKEKLKCDFPLNSTSITATAKSVTTMISTSKIASDVSSKRKTISKKTTTSKAIMKQKRNSTHTKKNTISSAETATSSFAVSTASTKTATTICSNRNQGIAIIAAEQKFSNSSKVSVAAVIGTKFSIPPLQAISSSCDEISKDETDVLKALNLSAKKLVEPPVTVPTSLSKSYTLLETHSKIKEKLKSKTPVVVERPVVENDNAVTEDIFEREHILKLRSESKTKITTDDSRESAESVKIRNAAMTLTTLQKKLASQINHDKTEIIEQKIKSNTNISTLDYKEQQKQKKKLSFLSSSPEMEISKTSSNIATVKISNQLAKRSCKLINIPTKTSVECIQRKCSKRKVKLTPKAKSLSTTTSPKTIGLMKLYQTRTPRAIETRLSKRLESTSANKRKNQEKMSFSIKTPSKSKRATTKLEITKKLEDDHKLETYTSNSSLFAPILIKQPKVMLETMTVQQLGLSPIKEQEQIKKDIEIIIQNTNENIISETSKNRNNNNDNVYKDDCNDEKEDNSENEDDEDPYDECEMITIDENDSEHFLKIIYPTSNENINSKNISSITAYDKKTLQTEMKIYLNNIPHVIKINDEIELFSKNCTTNVEQQNILTNSEQKRIIKNIPKKREKSAHILQYIDHNLPNSSLLSSSSSQVTSKDSCNINQKIDIRTNVFDNDYSNYHDNDQNKCDIDEKPQKISTSTPCKPKFRLHYKDRSNKEIITSKRIKTKDSNLTIMLSKNTKTCSSTGRLSANTEDNEQSSIKNDIHIATQIQHEQQQSSPTSIISSSDDQSKTLRQEDIYAVLSHLHGTDEATLGYR